MTESRRTWRRRCVRDGVEKGCDGGSLRCVVAPSRRIATKIFATARQHVMLRARDSRRRAVFYGRWLVIYNRSSSRTVAARLSTAATRSHVQARSYLRRRAFTHCRRQNIHNRVASYTILSAPFRTARRRPRRRQIVYDGVETHRVDAATHREDAAFARNSATLYTTPSRSVLSSSGCRQLEHDRS